MRTEKLTICLSIEGTEGKVGPLSRMNAPQPSKFTLVTVRSKAVVFLFFHILVSVLRCLSLYEHINVFC